ncbi:MAG: hypothetical protein IJT89_08960 [Bacteroidaceae bacterium]|jgi:hypothetical protein|uniref:DUF5640 domain-containing protein n=1 Tax=unclassified Bacteroides TaxID=2646097 RepID=UPI000AA60871|nr:MULTISPECIES: DUF5640 domain-containing protein [unclassified Bacteroides]MBQ3770521.1 hypothetical protein [Bacteroidaceae bacterium]MBQ4460419.1 hypothetical protein [Bacteroidaceae bacterium]MBQ7484166.1 hypothetical protein [Bacteroidaceae bacterium]
MRVKNLFWSVLTFMVVALMGMSFASCGSDDDDDEVTNPAEAIVGTWQGENDEGGLTYVFNADGKCTLVSEKNAVLFKVKTRKSGTYVLKDNKLTMSWTKFEQGMPLSDDTWFDMEGSKETSSMTISMSKKKLTFTEENGKKIEKPVVLTKK